MEKLIRSYIIDNCITEKQLDNELIKRGYGNRDRDIIIRIANGSFGGEQQVYYTMKYVKACDESLL